MKLLSPKKRRAILNITPLIDVLFILIIFFTVSSTFLEQPGIKLQLPQAQSSQPERVEKAILTIDANGKLFLGGNAVTDRDLPGQLKALIENTVDKSLIVNADKRVNHGRVVELMDIARRNGVQKLIISADRE